MNDSIKCQNCGFDIDISQSYKEKIEAEFRAQMLKDKKEFEKELNQKRAEYSLELAKLKEKEAKFDENLSNALNSALEKEKANLFIILKNKFESENLAKFEALNKELQEKSAKISEFNKQAAELEALKRKNAEMQSEYDLKTQKLINESLQKEREKISKQIYEETELKFRQINDEKENLKKQIDELKRKSDISSQQLQGETMELAIQEYLNQNFPLDDVEEIKKGVNGADVLQSVQTMEIKDCGKILYESKRTKNFSKEWIEKLKADMRESGAEVGILVTQTMPKELARVGLLDGVWVCTFEEFKGLCAVVRQGVINVAYTKKANQNRSSKMDLLYNYLTSNEFKMQALAIVDSFTAMEDNLIKEKNSMKRIWKEREKLIEKARDSAIEMHSSIKTIAGNQIKSIEILKLPYEE